MIAKALEWIKDNAAPHIREIDGVNWTDKSLIKIENVLKMDPMSFRTLTSLVEYLRSGLDVPNEFAHHVFINIDSPTNISVVSEVNHDNHYKRTQIAKVEAILPDVKIGKWLSQTEFCITLRACFLDSVDVASQIRWDDSDQTEAIRDTDLSALISMASNVVAGTVAQYEDTGISQKATIRTGIQEREDKILPEKVVLRPYRTFMEVEQPASEFLFRADDGKNDICFALYEADGGRWKMNAMAAIKAYLEEQLADLDYITITA